MIKNSVFEGIAKEELLLIKKNYTETIKFLQDDIDKCKKSMENADSKTADMYQNSIADANNKLNMIKADLQELEEYLSREEK